LSGSKADLFREMFFEEAGELLAALEAGLPALAPDAADRGRLDRVYRAAHSLKGAALMVGFQSISDLALEMERGLGQVRSGRAPWTGDLGQELTAQRERLAAMVESERSRFHGSSG
jgi:two-component system chemotaxis sensor kinase CheA